MNAFVGAYLIFLWSCFYSILVIAVVLIYSTSFSKTEPSEKNLMWKTDIKHNILATLTCTFACMINI